MSKKYLLAAAGLASTALMATASAETLTVATVNNSDMIIMQKLAPAWEKASGHKLNWVVLEENVLRQRLTTDIATKGGQFDITTIGAYETPIWGKNGWLTDLSALGDDYDYADIFEPVKNGLSSGGKMYAVPFYAETSFTFYRKDLFEAAGLKMPDQPTYDQIRQFADKLTDRSKEQYGICLRGKPGWGENMAFIGTLANTFGGSWFDMKWQPQLTSDAWKKAVNYYVDIMKADGPPGATANGHNENRALFATGKCAMWIDATSAAGYIFNPKESQVATKTGFVKAPIQVTPNGAGWGWAWALAVPATTKKADAAKSFVKWATSKEYVKMVGETQGWVAAPPGTRKSTYANPEYVKAAPFADTVLKAILASDPAKPTKDPVPYTGIQFVSIPEFQAIGTATGQAIAGALAGQTTVDAALKTANDNAKDAMTRAGYIK
jgi:sorbitol/mannitol transport system substrate-binding protein